MQNLKPIDIDLKVAKVSWILSWKTRFFTLFTLSLETQKVKQNKTWININFILLFYKSCFVAIWIIFWWLLTICNMFCLTLELQVKI